MTYDPSRDLIELALREDLALGDITSEATVPAGRQATAIMAGETGRSHFRAGDRAGGLRPGRSNRCLRTDWHWTATM